MKFVTRTRLIDRGQWFTDSLFLLLLPFLAVWKVMKLVASIRPVSQVRGR